MWILHIACPRILTGSDHRWFTPLGLLLATLRKKIEKRKIKIGKRGSLTLVVVFRIRVYTIAREIVPG